MFVRANDPDPGKYHVLIANAEGGDENSIVTGSMAAPMGDPVWSPDGKTIAAMRASSGQRQPGRNRFR